MVQIQAVPVGMIGTNCYLIYNDECHEGFIVDPGAQPQKIEKAVEEAGFKPIAVLLTHGHFDHILALQSMVGKYRIPVISGADEKNLLGDVELNESKNFHCPVTAIPDRTLENLEIVDLGGINVQCIFTPGHTEGSVCYYLKDEGTLLSGDTLFYRSVGRTDFATGSEEKLRESIGKLFSALPEDTMVLPGHGQATTIGYEKENSLF